MSTALESPMDAPRSNSASDSASDPASGRTLDLTVPPLIDGRRPRGRLNDRTVGLLLASPAIALLLTLTVLPAMLSFIGSFYRIPLSGHDWKFLGFGNYRYIVRDHAVRQAARNTLIYCLMTIIPSMAIGLGLALLTESLGRSRRLVRTLLFLPLTANLVAMAVTFRWIFATDGGFANQLLAMVGMGRVNFLGDSRTALATVAALGIWRQASFCMILFSAGLTTIPGSVHEAARSDGVRGLTKLRLVVLPLLRPTVVFATVISTLSAVQVFDTVNVMTGGGPLGASETVLTVAWRTGFQFFELGRSAALSFLLLTALLVVGIARARSIDRGTS